MPMDTLIAQAVIPTDVVGSPAAVAPLAPAHPDAVSKFGAAMAPEDLVAPVAPVTKLAPVTAPSSVDRTATLGDSILQGFNKVGENYRASRAELHKVLEGGMNDWTPVQMLGMQMRVADMSMHIELIVKGVAKTTQHIDQLSKLQ